MQGVNKNMTFILHLLVWKTQISKQTNMTKNK